MKITKTYLKQLIKEAMGNTEQASLQEGHMDEPLSQLDQLQAAAMVRSAFHLADKSEPSNRSHMLIKTYLEVALKLLEGVNVGDDESGAGGISVRRIPGANK
jgi:hypothetical protein